MSAHRSSIRRGEIMDYELEETTFIDVLETAVSIALGVFLGNWLSKKLKED
jgi:hypothetical protein